MLSITKFVQEMIVTREVICFHVGLLAPYLNVKVCGWKWMVKMDHVYNVM